jgi:hypothetical protein
MGSQLPEEAGPRLRLERPSEHVAVVVIDAPASANALNGRFFERPFRDAAQRFYRARSEPTADAGGSHETEGSGA